MLRLWMMVLLSVAAAGCGLAPVGVCPDEPTEDEPIWCAAHRDRNKYQEGLCPCELPPDDYIDPETGVTYGELQAWNWHHWPDDCVRGTGGVLEAVEYDEDTEEMFDLLLIDSDELMPGIQCCYDDAGQLSDSGTFDFQTPPGWRDFLRDPVGAFGALIRHVALDVSPFG